MDTTPAHAIPDPDEVLSHLEWVRTLAGRLVRDPAEADDLRQEVWLLSQRLNRPQRMPLKGWLGGILRNVVRERRRASGTRSLHEQASALDRAVARDTPAMVREISVQQIVLERLAQLREPYRSTLLACYFENLSHAEIAEREGVSLHAVRSRVQRGLKELRRDLAELDVRGTSALALLAFTTWDPASYAAAAASAGVGSSAALAKSASGSSLTLPLTAALVAGTAVALVFWQLRGPAGSGGSSVARSLTEVHGSRDVLETADATDPPASRAPATLDEGAAPPSGPDLAGGAEHALTGEARVLDLEGQPVAGIQVAYGRSVGGGGVDVGAFSVTDDDGFARVTGVVGHGTLVCESETYHQVGFPKAGEAAPLEGPAVAVVGRRTAASGRVETPQGEPISGAQVRLSYPGVVAGPVGPTLERSNQAEQRGTTAPDGTFSIDVAQGSAPLRLTVMRPGYMPHQEEGLVFDGEFEPLQVVLDHPASPRYCYGRVVGPDGEPLPLAWVADGRRATRADEGGVFELGAVAVGATLWAGAPGFRATSVGAPADLRGVEIALEAAALQLQGRVVCPDGTPAAGISIRLPSSTPAGHYYFYQAGRTVATPVTLETFGRPMETYYPVSQAATTDADGAFVVEGLLERDYELELTDPHTAQQITGMVLRAGSRDVRVEFPAPLEPLVGSVLTPDGAPIGGALVQTSFGSTVRTRGPQTRTDSRGRFQLGGVAPGTMLHVATELPWVHRGAIVTEERTLEIEVEPAARVLLTIDRSERSLLGERQPTSVTFQDRSGAVVPVVVDGLLGFRKERVTVPGDASKIAELRPLTVSTRARELLLWDRDGLIIAIPLDLAPGAEVQLSE